MPARLGCDATVCTVAAQTVALALAGEVDLVSLDITMPSLDGRALPVPLRLHEQARRLPNLPVIAVAGRVAAADGAAALAAGFAAPLGKPALLEDPERALDAALTLRSALCRTRCTLDRLRIGASLSL